MTNREPSIQQQCLRHISIQGARHISNRVPDVEIQGVRYIDYKVPNLLNTGCKVYWIRDTKTMSYNFGFLKSKYWLISATNCFSFSNCALNSIETECEGWSPSSPNSLSVGRLRLHESIPCWPKSLNPLCGRQTGEGYHKSSLNTPILQQKYEGLKKTLGQCVDWRTPMVTKPFPVSRRPTDFLEANHFIGCWCPLGFSVFGFPLTNQFRALCTVP